LLQPFIKRFKGLSLRNGVVYWTYRSSKDPVAGGASDKAWLI